MRAFLFDMDGVLVDVSRSYRAAIQNVIEFFLGIKIKNSQIQEYKDHGGFNNDWELTYTILLDKGLKADLNYVTEIFQKYYLGRNYNGLIINEKWLLKRTILKNLMTSARTGIVTGRPLQEALYTLKRFRVEHYFPTLITMDDLPAGKAKPDPTGIKTALRQLQVQAKQAYYFGDSVDDINAAVRAGVIPIGIIPPGADNTKHNQLLKSQGARLVLNNINQIKEL